MKRQAGWPEGCHGIVTGMISINKKLFILVGLTVAFGLGSLVVLPSKVLAEKCVDGTNVDERFLERGGNIETFCKNRGGVASGAECDNGTPIPQKEFDSGKANEFCKSKNSTYKAVGNPQNETIKRNQEEFECKKDPNLSEQQNLDKCVNENPIVATLRTIVNFLTVGVGMVITIVIIIAGIQYSTSQGDPQKAAKARGRAINAVVALAAYIFLSAFLQWVIPGGLF